MVEALIGLMGFEGGVLGSVALVPSFGDGAGEGGQGGEDQGGDQHADHQLGQCESGAAAVKGEVVGIKLQLVHRVKA